VTTINPRDYPDLYAQHVLGTAVSPGVVTFSGHDRQQTWDKQKAKGQKGATSKLDGEDIIEFQASYWLATTEDQLAWPAFRAVIRSTTHPEPKALPIYHPDLAEQHITEVCQASIGGAIRDSKGGVTYLVKYIEFKPPKSAPAKASSGGTAGSKASKPEPYDPNRAAKRELDGLLDEAAKP
jgi:hypothetical protein